MSSDDVKVALSALAPIMLVFGWRIAKQQELRRERRADVERLIALIDRIDGNVQDYYLPEIGGRASKKAFAIKKDLSSLSLQLDTLAGEQFDELYFQLKDAATGSDFESEPDPSVAPEDRIDRIASACGLLKEEMRRWAKR